MLSKNRNKSFASDPFTTFDKKITKFEKPNDVFIETDPERSAGEPSISAHPSDPNMVLAFERGRIEGFDSSTDRTCDLYRSTDGAKTWSSRVESIIPSNDDGCTDPLIRWAPDDGADLDKSVRAYELYMGLRETSSDILVSHSDDNGLTWSDPVIAITGTDDVNIPDKPWMTTFYNFPDKKNAENNDRVYVVSMKFFGELPDNPEENPDGNCQVVFSKSIDGGESFPNSDSPTILAESVDCVPRMEGPIIAGGADNSLLVCWYNSEITTFSDLFDIRCKTSLDGGDTFSDEFTVVDDAGELPFWKCPNLSYHRVHGAMLPSLEITPDGVAHMVYTADPSPGDTDGECGDIYYAKSPFPWHEWAPTEDHQRVNDDSTDTFQGFATITSKRIGIDSTLVVAWEDDRNSIETGKPNSLYDIYAAIIDKNGNISPNKRVSDESSYSDFIFIADYFDITVHRLVGDKIAYVTWTDRRDKSSEFDLEDDVAVDTIKIPNVIK
jgi:hypothetical protein